MTNEPIDPADPTNNDITNEDITSADMTNDETNSTDFSDSADQNPSIEETRTDGSRVNESTEFEAAPEYADVLVDEAAWQAPQAPPAPYVAPTAAERNRLVRDPYASFGGVASGIAYRLGWNVALVRLAVLAIIVFTGGAAIPLYLIAWLVIPRALVWPPVGGTPVAGRNGGRGLGIVALLTAGLIALTALVAIPVGVVAIGAALHEDDLNFSIGNDDFRLGIYSPTTLDDLPSVISSESGFVKVNLDNLPSSEFAALDEPFVLDITLEEGEVLLELPENLSYSLHATTTDGSIDTNGFDGSLDSDTRRAISVDHENPDIIINITVDDGDIEVESV